MTTIVKFSASPAGRRVVAQAFRDAGLRVVEAESWEQATDALGRGEAALVLCASELPGDPGEGAAHAAAAIVERNKSAPPGIAPDLMRSLSHDLRTPLSAMSGWLHLIDSGKLDDAALRRAITRLRGSIDDQVRTIDRYLGAGAQEGHRSHEA
jgi:signal transduction histidine kinase